MRDGRHDLRMRLQRSAIDRDLAALARPRYRQLHHRAKDLPLGCIHPQLLDELLVDLVVTLSHLVAASLAIRNRTTGPAAAISGPLLRARCRWCCCQLHIMKLPATILLLLLLVVIFLVVV
jgi:hypothetical protein